MCFSVFLIVLYRKHSSFFIDFKDSVISCQLKTNNTLTSITGSEKVVDVSHTHTAINVFLSLLFPAAKHWLRISTSFHPPAPPLSPSLLLPSLTPHSLPPSLLPTAVRGERDPAVSHWSPDRLPSLYYSELAELRDNGLGSQWLYNSRTGLNELGYTKTSADGPVF